MPLRIYNTLSKKKELFKPRQGKKVNIFVCGPTVYDFAHLGHARSDIIFDCFVKYLKSRGYEIFYLQNITNVDDKIILKAKEKGVLPEDLAKAFEQDYLKDMRSLGVTSVTTYARATDYIKEIISQVEQLVQKDYAYRLDDGIYFNIKKFRRYGKLSGRTALQADDAVSRIDYSSQKKNRGDFCLWKFADNHLGEPSWPSPFGLGRPGWHIEDTAITEKFFGPQYDIHGGGRDLIFPHHEAEVAQMEAISGRHPLAKYWMHTGFLTFNGQKMSKSLNNGITIEAFLSRHSVEQLRFWVAKNLWRSPMDYSESTMMEVKAALEKIEEFLRKLKLAQKKQDTRNNNQIKKLLQRAKNDFYKSLDDDFNTPKALAALFDFIKETNKALEVFGPSPKDAKAIAGFFEELNDIFGIIDFRKATQSNVPHEVKALVKERERYRKAADWQKADTVRQEITKYGFSVEDTSRGPIIKKN